VSKEIVVKAKLADSRDQNHKAIIAYLRDCFDCDIANIFGGSKGDILVVLKGLPKGVLQAALQQINAAANGAKSGDCLEEFKQAMSSMGSKYAMLCLGAIDAGTMTVTTGCEVVYNGEILLDYAEPDFFDKLDRVIDHIKTHGGLSGLSLRAGDAPLQFQPEPPPSSAGDHE